MAVFLDSLAVPGTILLLRLPARNPRCSRLAQTVRRSSCRTCAADGVRLGGVGSGIVRAHTSLPAGRHPVSSAGHTDTGPGPIGCFAARCGPTSATT